MGKVMSHQNARKGRLAAGGSLLALAAAMSFGQAAMAQAPDASSAQKRDEKEVSSVVVTASGGRAAYVAPVTSSLAATEPTAVITRKFIEESAPRVGDFTTTAALAVSMVASPNPNGPGATDGAKITLRGFKDGEFNITYDDIAWGDTNGPSHHANSFFPSSTIGGVVINRGPGSALDLGQANFGGQVNLYSLPLEDRFTIRQTATVGTWNTLQAVTTIATGPVAALHDTNFVFNFMEYKTKGYLTNSPSDGDNQFLKFTTPINPKLSVTVLYTHNWDTYNQSDSSTPATVAQTEAYGPRFSLSDDPRYQTYSAYNYTKKSTEFGYVRESFEPWAGAKVDNTTYTYWYGNKTLSANNGAADPTIGATALTAANKVILTPAAAYPIGGAGYPSASAVAGLPGYHKLNWYRVTGDNIKIHQDLGPGVLSGGVMYERAITKRFRLDIDLLTGQSDFREKAALLPGVSGCDGNPVTVAPGKTYNGICQVPLSIAYLEYSGWRQYQLYAQYQWKPTDDLTITPGIKHVNFQLYVHAPVLAVKGSLQPSYTEATHSKTLPFLTVNYRAAPNWSIFGEYAQGFLVPNIGVNYVNNPGKNDVEPQLSTNYQLGTVFNSGMLTLDGDVYYIEFKNKIQTLIDLATNESYTSNSGGATYKGVEGQATYVLPAGFSVFANGSLNSSLGNGDAANPGYNGRQLANAPFWTSGLGLRFEKHGLFMGDDSLIATLNDKHVGPQFANAASGVKSHSGKIHAYGQADLSATYKIDRYSIEAQVLNVADGHAIASFKGSALVPGTNLPATTVAGGGAANVFTRQTGRSYQLTLKAVF